MTEIEQLHQRFCHYSLAFKGNTPRTVRWFAEIFRYFARFARVEAPLQITRESVESWVVEGKIRKNWAAKTIKNRLQALGSFTKWLRKNGHIERDPMEDIDRPALPKRIPAHLPKSEAVRLIDWARNFPFAYRFERKRAPAIIALFIFTGVRLQELLDLKMSDIDLQNKTLFVKFGKGEKDRIIPLPQSLIVILEEYLKDRKRLKKTCPYFFTSMRADDQMKSYVIKRLIRKLHKASGIYFYPHLLRHTFAVLMLEGGCNLFALSQMMGHSDIKTTTIYLSATTTHLQEEMRKHPLNGV